MRGVASLEQTAAPVVSEASAPWLVAERELGGALQQPDVGHVWVDLDGGVGAADGLLVVAAVEGDEREESVPEEVAVAAEVERALRVFDGGGRLAAARVGECTGDRVVGVGSEEACAGAAGVRGREVLVSGDRPVVGSDRRRGSRRRLSERRLGGRGDRGVWRGGDREVVDPGSPDDDECRDREPEAVGDTADRPFDDEAEADEEQRCGEDREHGRVLRRAGVPGDPCRRERLLFEDLTLCIELERATAR